MLTLESNIRPLMLKNNGREGQIAELLILLKTGLLLRHINRSIATHFAFFSITIFLQ